MSRISSDELFCMLATMPRSGTWYSFFFFEYFDSFLTGRTPIRTQAMTYLYRGLGITKAHGHLMCPSFPDHYKEPLRAAWDSLEFKSDGINSGYEELVVKRGQQFDLWRNPQLRIAYLYRNPLDQAVSHFHTLYWREKTMEPDRFRSGLLKWVREVSIESYIKQYFTYHVMRQAYRDSVLCIAYEDLVRAPHKYFKKIALHFGFAVEASEEQRCFEQALQATTTTSMRQLESRLGHAFGHPEIRNDSHIHDGSIGKWQKWLDEETVTYAENRLREYGLSLRHFVLT